jgi:hypothetical protein
MVGAHEHVTGVMAPFIGHRRARLSRRCSRFKERLHPK